MSHKISNKLSLINPSLLCDKNNNWLPLKHIPKIKRICENYIYKHSMDYTDMNDTNTINNADLQICKYVKVTFPLHKTYDIFKIIDQIKIKQNAIKIFSNNDQDKDNAYFV